MKCNRERCDFCKKWVDGDTGLSLVFDQSHKNYDLLECDDEFFICIKCCKKFNTIDREEVSKNFDVMRSRTA